MEIISAYGFCNVGSVNVYDIDYAEEKVLAGINDEEPRWYDITEDLLGETGFFIEDWFVRFSDVMRG